MTTAPALRDEALLGRGAEPITAAGDGAPYDLVFLDRDGTLNVHRPGYIARPADLVLLPGAGEAVRMLNEAGCRVVLATNQRGIATGALTWRQLRAVQRALVSGLADHGAHLDAVRVCPHEQGCECRKPAPGMLRDALRLAPWASPDRCVMIGDRPSDIAAARSLGISASRIGQDGSDLLAVVRHLLGRKPA